jgi:hypothetical protein
MITTNRNISVGGHTTPDVKEALRVEAKKRKCTISALVHHILRREMRKLGHPVTGYEYRIAYEAQNK